MVKLQDHAAEFGVHGFGPTKSVSPDGCFN
jgi:hypothetical protein